MIHPDEIPGVPARYTFKQAKAFIPAGAYVCVGGGVFPWHSRFPPTETRLMSDAALALLPWI